MKTLFRKTLAVLASLLMIVSAFSCQDAGKDTDVPSRTETPESAAPDGSDDPVLLPKEADVMKIALTAPDGHPLYRYAEKGDPGYADADYTSFYAEYGRDIRITDVHENTDTGLAYILLDGQPHYLGLDFLSRAMIYNCAPSGDYPSEEDVYRAWWRYYVTRWNKMLPEIPLYSEGALLLYSAQVKGPEKLSAASSFSLPKAVLQWQVPEKDSDLLVIGTAGKLSGQFRYPAFSRDTVSPADAAVGELTNGLETVTVTEDGRPVWNDSVVHHHEEKENEDGSRTYTVTLWEDLRFSDGSQVTAKDYLAFPLAFLSAPGKEADASYADQMGRIYSGFDLIDDMTFSVTIAADALPDANILSAVRFTAQYAEMWLGDAEITNEGDGCFLSDSFYERGADGHFLSARRLRETASDPRVLLNYPFSGPYTVIRYDGAAAGDSQMAILRRNDRYIGLPEGTEPIGTLVFKYVDEKDALAQFEENTLEVYNGLSGEAEVREALSYAEQSGGKLKTFRYETGETCVLHFRADLGPAQFMEVRQALACLLGRNDLAETVTGGAATVPAGPYTKGALYEAAVKNGMKLDSYGGGTGRAMLFLEEGGWIYDAKGEPYKSGIRYKKIDASLMGPDDRSYIAADESLKTFEKDGYYYMPLVLNFFGLKNTSLTAALTECFKNADFASAGMLVTVTEGSFQEAMDELYEEPLSGYYGGVPVMCVYNAFTRDYEGLLADDSFLWAVDPEEYRRFSQHFLRDPEDIVWLSE